MVGQQQSLVVVAVETFLGRRTTGRQGDAWFGPMLALAPVARLHLCVRAAGRGRADHATEM